MSSLLVCGRKDHVSAALGGAGSRAVLVQGRCWLKGGAGSRAVLAQGRCWLKGSAGSRAVLAQGQCWLKGGAGVTFQGELKRLRIPKGPAELELASVTNPVGAVGHSRARPLK